MRKTISEVRKAKNPLGFFAQGLARLAVKHQTHKNFEVKTCRHRNGFGTSNPEYHNRKIKYSLKFSLVIFLTLLQITAKGQSLIAHYPFDNNATDISGNNNNGIIIGGVQSASDRYGNPCGALLFNGIDGYIEVADSRTLKSPLNNFSATCWFKMQKNSTSGYNWLTLICKGRNSLETMDNPQYRVQVFQSFTQSTISINTDFTEYDHGFNSHLFKQDEWGFYALVYDGEYVKAYLNAVEIWRFPYTKPLVQNDEPLHIAKDIPGATEFFSGCFDDLRIFSSALKPDQIEKIYKDDSYSIFDNDFSLICPGNMSVNNDKEKCYALVSYDQPVVGIKCGSATLKQIAGPASGAEFPIGTTTLIFEAQSNDGFKKSCYSKVTVKDTEPPVFKFISDTTLIIDEANLIGKFYYYELPVAMDNCSFTIKMKDGLPSGSRFPEGKTVLTFTATDKSGNESELSYTVHVIRRPKSGSKNCPYDIIKANDYRECGAIATFNFQDTANNKVLKLIEGHSSGSFYKVGDTRNKYINGFSEECVFTVTVYDDEKPVMLCQRDTIVYTGKKEKGAKFYYIKPRASDNCKIDTIYLAKGLKSGEFYPVGVTQNVFTALDIYGNSVQCSFNVTVIDTSVAKKVREPIFVHENFKDSIKYRPGLEFNKCILTLVMYDDSKQDMDTISVYFNGKEIIKKELITIKKNGTLNRVLVIEPYENNHFVFKAWNEGQISPNTLMIEFYEGYYLDNLKKLKRKKPSQTIVLHSRIGVASAISLRCKDQR